MLATEMDRSRSAAAARAIREYAEQEYAALRAAREGEKDIAEGSGVSTGEAMVAWRLGNIPAKASRR